MIEPIACDPPYLKASPRISMGPYVDAEAMRLSLDCLVLPAHNGFDLTVPMSLVFQPPELKAMHRGEMIQRLNLWMQTGYELFLDEGQNAKGGNLLKSYLLEVNAPERIRAEEGLSAFFESVDLDTPFEMKPSEDPTIHEIVLGIHGVRFYLDTLDSRFWVLHSTDPASMADQAVNDLVLRTRLFDSMWLPTNEFEAWLPQAGTPKIMTSKFAVNAGLYREALPEDNFADESMLLKIGAQHNVLPRWNYYKQIEALRRHQALWSARLVRSDGDPDFPSRVISDITAAGKVTAKGTSFEFHDAVLRVFISRYRALLEDWEDRYRLNWSRDSRGLSPKGEVVRVRWEEPLQAESLHQLASELFTCGEPYRLYGVSVDHGRGRLSASAVDLHTGGRLNLELLPDGLWVHLFPETCGNVLTRLLTNLQHYHDARTKLDE